MEDYENRECLELFVQTIIDVDSLSIYESITSVSPWFKKIADSYLKLNLPEESHQVKKCTKTIREKEEPLSPRDLLLVIAKFYRRHLIKSELLEESHQETNKRRNWKKEWKGFNHLLRRLTVEEMQIALSEKNKVIETSRDRTKLKDRFKKIYPRPIHLFSICCAEMQYIF